MPCRDWLEAETSAADERIKHLKTDVDKIRTKMNLLTKLLCEAGNIMVKVDKEASGPGLCSNNMPKTPCNDNMSKELKDWLWTHNREDRKRNK